MHKGVKVIVPRINGPLFLNINRFPHFLQSTIQKKMEKIRGKGILNVHFLLELNFHLQKKMGEETKIMKLWHNM